MREELIEKAARAIAPGVWSLFDLWQGDESKLNDWHRAELAMSKSNGAKALDAILDALAEPSEEMVAAGASASKTWDDSDDAYFENLVRSILRAMLKPLKGDAPSRPSDPGIPMYRFPDGTDEALRQSNP